MEMNIAQFEPDSFKYEPLPTASSIRLLTLFACKDSESDHKGFIKGILRTVDLNDGPIYKRFPTHGETLSANTQIQNSTLTRRVRNERSL